jgi:hypothetical protein
MGFLSGLIDPGNFFGGNSGGVSLSGIFDPAGAALSGAGAMPDFYDNATGKIDDWAGDLYDFEKSQLSDWARRFKNDPTQLLIGAGDPFSAKMWGGITGKEYEPYVNQMGGPTEGAYQSAERKGVNTSNSRGSHQIAGAIASYFGGGALGNLAGAAGTATGIGANAGQALGGAAVGAGNAWANNGDVMQGALSGGLGGYLGNMDYGSGLGFENEALRRGFNGAVGGAANSALSGGNIGEGALMGGAKGAAGGIYDMYNAGDMPDVGTIGGTMQDEYGESSATMGGATLPIQQQANDQRAQALSASYGTNSVSPSSSSAVDSFINAISGGGGNRLSMGNIGDFAAQAMGMYDNNRQRRRAKEQAAGLANLYSPNSPYAQSMRQQLERKDAAAGRRSQYGPREAELAARLTDSQARMAPTLNSLYNQENQARTNMYRDGLRLGRGLYSIYGD